MGLERLGQDGSKVYKVSVHVDIAQSLTGLFGFDLTLQFL